MRFKKVVSGLLTAALVMTSVQVSAAESKVTEGVPTEGLVASFTFDDATLNNGKTEDDSEVSAPASAIVPAPSGTTECAAYTGEVEYVAGKSGRGVRIQDYGLKLNQENLGKDYTVSMWVKPDGAIATNANVLFLGRTDKDDTWTGIAGENSSATCKLWVNGTAADGSSVEWVTTAGPEIDSTAWHHLVVTGSDGAATVYVDGTAVKNISNTSVPNSLDGEGRDVLIGVTAWDPPFVGTVDEVNIYNKTLTADGVAALYNVTKDAENTKGDLFTWGEVKASISGAVNKGSKKQITVTLPEGLDTADVTISYESDTTDVAEVDETGVVTGKAVGTATITATVKLNTEGEEGEEEEETQEKTAAVEVRVLDPETSTYPDDLIAYYNFDDKTINNAVAKDSSGQAVLKGNGNTSYSKDAVFAESINTEKGSAIQLGDYGLKLEQSNLGTDFTVSMWLKPTATIANNGAVTLLGYNSPENWVAIAGQNNTDNETKIWANDAVGGSYSWTTLSTQTFNQDWHHVAFVGTDGELSFYMDGVKKWTKDSTNPLDGTDHDILVGLTYWAADACFPGLVDEIQVYDTAKTDAEIVQLDKELFKEMLQSKVDAAFTDEVLLGKNTDKAEVKWNLNLPTELDGVTVTWESTAPEIIATDGTVNNQEEEKEVTLTARATAGTLEATKTLKVTVAALDREALNQLVEEAGTIDTTYATEASKTRLEAAIAAGKTAQSYEEVETASTELTKAISGLKLVEEYANPFGLIAEPTAKQTIKVGESRQMLYVPDSIKETTTISYLSSDENVVAYADGIATAKAEGKATVTAIVTSEYNHYVMEYSVALDITKADPVNPGSDSSTGVNPGSGSDTGTGTTDDVKQPTLNVKKITLGLGETFTLKVANTTGKVTYKSSKTKYVKVTSAGKITAKKKGSATITATLADGTKLTCKVTVKKAPKKISLAKKSVTLKKGKTYKIKVKLPANTASYKITYKTSSKKVATVDTAGKVTAKKKGKATITVTTFNKKKATLKVTVK